MPKGITLVLTLVLLFFVPAPAAGADMISAEEMRTSNSVRDKRLDAYALTHATLYRSADIRLEDATLLIRGGLVVSAEAKGSIPEGFVEIDLAGRFIYPGLIDMHTGYGLPELEEVPNVRPAGSEVLFSSNASAYNANETIRAHYSAAAEFKVDDEAAGKLRKLGFSAVLTLRADGVARGTSSLVTLGKDLVNDVVLNAKAAAHYSFQKGSSKQLYPVSRMGSVALLRQTYLDAEWYGAQQPRPFSDLSLEAWLEARHLPQIFETTNWKTALLADEVGDEFGVQYIIEGSGDEYQRLELIKATRAAFILPVNFPEAFDVEDPVDAKRVTLREMKHWELAPYNLARLARAKVVFAITAKGDHGNFWKNLRLAVENGLEKSAALAALTSVPAALLGESGRLGSLEPGRLASFIITDGDLFDKETKINENWIRGKKFLINEFLPDPSGLYQLIVGDQQYRLEITGKSGKRKARIVDDKDDPSDETKVTSKTGTKLSIKRDLISLGFTPAGGDQAIRLTGWRIDGGWKGNGRLANGDSVTWRLTFLEPVAADSGDSENDFGNGSGKKEAPQSGQSEPGAVIYPFVAYGRQEMPQPVDLLIKNTTVWTSEDIGVLQHTDVLIRNGKIAKIGQNLTDSAAIEIDGSGQHLTAGIIDEHSHIALDYVNDVAVNSSMVRMADVVNSEDVAIYRDLAGGVTAAQLLHGSANPIGGQSAMIKMRWGSPPRQMLIANADKFIKFALGENVKRSRNPVSVRYPQTRMGVEQVYMDAFGQALKYKQRRDEFNNLSRSARRKTVEPRRDLAHETLLEILKGERFVTSHSYVQSEINMLMKVAEFYGFRINTFTHILEGYKVADKMAAHGAGGSTFSDWWAYKWEVRYAIPYNVALMHQAGVITAINSDDAETSRRLNQEAAKAIKYGGMSEIEALNLVTINPARLLHLDGSMGSIKVTKDADIVLWSDHPLSIYARVNKTLVDGIVYYDIDDDIKARQSIKTERARLIQKIRLAFDKAKKDEQLKSVEHKRQQKPNPKHGPQHGSIKELQRRHELELGT